MATRRLSRTLLFTGATAMMAVSLSGCGSFRRAVGSEKVTPDEFRVLTKAPLVVPPEYNLRPPKAGEARPQDLAADEVAAAALTDSTASDAEQLLLAKAGSGRSQPGIRTIVDVEGAGVVRKNKSFADRILFWRGRDDSDNPTAEEAARRTESIDNATGGGDIVVKKNSRSKIPGL